MCCIYIFNLVCIILTVNKLNRLKRVQQILVCTILYDNILYNNSMYKYSSPKKTNTKIFFSKPNNVVTFMPMKAVCKLLPDFNIYNQ